ncbi:MAG TPA: hypothetical protein VL282_06355 [Tepidisphaeraceae bacterium]|nr:hypothetical protein [Tepidisphaeraceae bacterium]
MEERAGWHPWALLIALLLVALLLRGWNFPREREIRDIDEFGYLVSSLNLAEGVTPAFKAAPGGAQIWLGWSYVITKTSALLVRPTPEERDVPLAVRPYVALNHVLWDCYYNIGPLRRFELICIGIASVLAVIPAFFLGRHYAGLIGAIFLGGLVAILPLFVSLSGQTRPYSLAWSIGWFAIWQAVRSAPRGRFALAAALVGLAIATRVEMLLVLPFVVAEHLVNGPAEGRARRALFFVLVSMLAAAAAAPWFTIGILGNLKSIAGVRLMAGGNERPSIIRCLIDFGWTGALLVPLLLVLLAIFSPLPANLRRYRRLALAAALLSLMVLRPSGYGAQHDGPVYLLISLYSVIGLAALARWSVRTTQISVFIALLLATAQCVYKVHNDRKAYAPVADEQWIEKYIPAGTKIYFSSAHYRPILPTPQSANAIWMSVVDPSTWERKFRWGTERLGVVSSEAPRALSMDGMAKEIGFARQWYILGGRTFVNSPRYDLHVFGQSAAQEQVDFPAVFAQGSCVIASREAIPSLGKPTAQWTSGGQVRAAIYCTKDIADKIPPQAKDHQP